MRPPQRLRQRFGPSAKSVDRIAGDTERCDARAERAVGGADQQLVAEAFALFLEKIRGDTEDSIHEQAAHQRHYHRHRADGSERFAAEAECADAGEVVEILCEEGQAVTAVAIVSVLILVMRFVDLYWLVMPDFRQGGFGVSWMEQARAKSLSFPTGW